MKRTLKRALSVLLALLTTCSIMTAGIVSASAADEQVDTSSFGAVVNLLTRIGNVGSCIGCLSGFMLSVLFNLDQVRDIGTAIEEVCLSLLNPEELGMTPEELASMRTQELLILAVNNADARPDEVVIAAARSVVPNTLLLDISTGIGTFFGWLFLPLQWLWFGIINGVVAIMPHD
jgi:hypothetical protein